jgi:hypothetical protein
MFPKERRKGDCGNAINSDSSGNFRGNYAKRPSESESLWKKMIGKPDSGKPTVRFDEGELEIEPNSHYASSLLYCKSRLQSGYADGDLPRKQT